MELFHLVAAKSTNNRIAFSLAANRSETRTKNHCQLCQNIETAKCNSANVLKQNLDKYDGQAWKYRFCLLKWMFPYLREKSII